ncbi:hypothetical protein D3C84_1237830 [compost metagenome]
MSESRFHHYSASPFVQMKQPVNDNDPLRIIDHELFTKPDAVAMMLKNERLMSNFSNVMGSIVITAWKA